MKHLKINIEDIKDMGMELTGELDADIFDLPKGDAIALSPLHYELYAQLMDKELFVSGKIFTTFEFECVRTLKRFAQTLTIDPLHISLDTNNKQIIDISDELREELVLAFPSYPKCDEGDTPEESNLNSSYLSVDKHPQERVNNSGTDGTSGVWDALDSLPQNLNEHL